MTNKEKKLMSPGHQRPALGGGRGQVDPGGGQRGPHLDGVPQQRALPRGDQAVQAAPHLLPPPGHSVLGAAGAPCEWDSGFIITQSK